MSSSGKLPFATYHRASQLGAGTYGSVVCAYNEDGDEVALKIFSNDTSNDDDDSSEDDRSDSDSDEEERPTPLELGALREISCLRLLRDDNGHPNIIQLIDIQPHWSDTSDPAGGHSSSTSDNLCMALPLYHGKSLQVALENGYPMDRRTKVEIAHGLLSALAYLDDNRLMHRDIKPDNVMLESTSNENESPTGSQGGGGATWKPILIDFSLAKQLADDEDEDDDEPAMHTSGAGTASYMAPEVADREPYGSPADVWSVGVVLLELLVGSPMPVQKEKHTLGWIETTLEGLPDLPFPNLIRQLLRQDPSERWTARQALAHPLFVEKFQLPVPPRRIIDVATALPLEVEDKKIPRKRRERVVRVCRYLEATNPQTMRAALEYTAALAQLDDSIDDPKSNLVLHCVVLAFRFFEVEYLDLSELHEQEKGLFADWTLEDYVDEEATIFMLLDFCLYSRGVIE